MVRPPLLALALLLAQAAPTWADETSDRRAAAVALLNQMHTIDNAAAMLQPIMAQVRQGTTRDDPDLLKQFDTIAPKLESEAQAEKADLIEQLATIYAETFTTDEIKAMAAFYQTPIGRKIVATQAHIGNEIFRVTREWGTRVGRKLVTDAETELQSAKP